MHTIGDLVSHIDIDFCVNDDFLLPVNGDNLGRTIGGTTVVDEPSNSMRQ
jgi:hypothetical protein